MQYVITPDANKVWASTGAIVSPNKGVGTDAYPNDLVVREAQVAHRAPRRSGTTGPTCCPPASRARDGRAPPASDRRGQDRLGRLPDARQGRLGRRVTERSHLARPERGRPSGRPRPVIREGGADGCRSARWGRRGRRGDERGTSHITRNAHRRTSLRPDRHPVPRPDRRSSCSSSSIYPTIYTIALSFNRGRRGEFTEWVGLQHYIGLLNDKASST